MKRILNLGAGTQSSVLLLMMETGEMPRADVAIFADTGWEPKAVYDHLQWLKARTTVHIVTVQAGNIYDDAMRSQVANNKAKEGDERNRWASMPLFVLNNQKQYRGPGDTLWGHDDGTYTRELAEPEEGKITRQCTDEYKKDPIQRYIKTEILGLPVRSHWPKEPVVTQVFGISFDERQRMKLPDPWAIFEYPFVEMRWQRERVIAWGREHFPGYTFPRSACVGCPFHSNAEWRNIRDTEPESWREAVALDEKIRNAGGMRGQVYLHRDCVPLAQARIDDVDTNQTYLDAGFANECKGMCGV